MVENKPLIKKAPKFKPQQNSPNDLFQRYWVHPWDKMYVTLYVSDRYSRRIILAICLISWWHIKPFCRQQSISKTCSVSRSVNLVRTISRSAANCPLHHFCNKYEINPNPVAAYSILTSLLPLHIGSHKLDQLSVLHMCETEIHVQTLKLEHPIQ